MPKARSDSPSIWVGTTPETSYPPLAADPVTDVCIVGAGITGLTAAYLLARAGRGVVVLDRWPVASGTTGHTTAKVSVLQGLAYSSLEQQVGADAATDYAAATLAAQQRLAAIVAQEGIACDLQRLPAYTWTEEPDRIEDVRGEVDAATAAGLPAVWVDAVPLPWPTLGGVRLDDQLAFHPRRYCLGLADIVAQAGGAIHEGTAAREVKEDGDDVLVVTESGTVRCAAVIIATLLPFHDPLLLGARTEPSRSYALAARIEGPLPPGLLLSAETPHRSVRPFTPLDDPGYLIVEGEEHVPGGERDVSRHHADLESWTREHFPVASIDYRWSAQDYMTPDGMPFIGRATPASDRVLVATGFNKWGMTNGTLAAMLLTDLIDGRESPWLERFSATRLGAQGAMGQLVSHNVQVAKHFVADRVRRGPSVAAIAPGSGAVVDQAAGKAAVYRKPDGSVHALSARCTHMGCIVAYNDAEGSWDCPCHGSRFDLQGRVIEGPAGAPLEAVELEG
jgi:glycine/D-amino acid oxidase-like deaminating enzyme/nitrite reductase/ring-hydroxylating ferredoxin subunit